jgi:hypothetical protein
VAGERAVDELSDILENFRRSQELRDSWQGKLLAKARTKDYMVALSVIATNYDEMMIPLLRAVHPGWIEPSLPCLCSSGRVAKSGAIFAQCMFHQGRKYVVLYKDERELRDCFRRLADQAKLADDERIEMFQAIRNWIKADYRLDPTMDPHDPDARRLVH